MRKKMNCKLYGLMFYLLSSLALGARSSHLEELKSNYPYGLLSDDYGILTLDDLAVSACTAHPTPISSTSHSYQYWQCFESKNILFDCDSSGIPDKHEGVMGLVVVKSSSPNTQHDYIERRLWPIKECKNFLRDAANILKGTQYACISGSFIENEKDQLGHLTTSWVFDRLKTKKGCEGHGCEFNKKFRQDNCPNL